VATIYLMHMNGYTISDSTMGDFEACLFLKCDCANFGRIVQCIVYYLMVALLHLIHLCSWYNCMSKNVANSNSVLAVRIGPLKHC
jgi:hypothetical protein